MDIRDKAYDPRPLDVSGIRLSEAGERLAGLVAESLYNFRSFFAAGLGAFTSWSSLPVSDRLRMVDEVKDSVKFVESKYGLLNFQYNLVKDDMTVVTENIARDAHERLVRSRLDDGWKYGEVEDPENKRSRFLVPYNDLSARDRVPFFSLGDAFAKELMKMNERKGLKVRDPRQEKEDARRRRAVDNYNRMCYAEKTPGKGVKLI